MAATSQPDGGELRQIPVSWVLESGPAPLVNQIVMQTVLDADNGPGEIVVNLGYVTPPLLPPTESGPSQFPDAVSVTTVARFSMTRRRAQELAEILQKHIGDWDNGDRIVRGGDQ